MSQSVLSDHPGNTSGSSPQFRSRQSLGVTKTELKWETSLSDRRLDVRKGEREGGRERERARERKRERGRERETREILISSYVQLTKDPTCFCSITL